MMSRAAAACASVVICAAGSWQAGQDRLPPPSTTLQPHPVHHPGDLQPLDWRRSNRMTRDKQHTTPLVPLLATGWSHAHGGNPSTWSQ